jgi:serine/threonine-protein kinase
VFGKKKKRKSRGGAARGAAPPADGDASAEPGRPAAADAARPERIGRYGVADLLGEGGMGRVYLGRDPVIGRGVAIKVITMRPDLGEDDARQYRERFLREAQAAGALVHPNIVAVYDIGQDRETGSPYIVMEHVPGRDLRRVIREWAPLPAADAVRIVMQIGAALDYAHRRGIVHRDIKPANVLISERGQVKITDFGVARLPGSDLTRSDQFVGSPGFMSPEQLRGAAVDGRADLFALGVILYELLTGRAPFDGENVSEVLYRITSQPAEPPSEVCPDVSADFDPILERALAKDPAARFQSGQEFIAALRALPLEGAGEAGARDEAPAPADDGAAGATGEGGTAQAAAGAAAAEDAAGEARTAEAAGPQAGPGEEVSAAMRDDARPGGRPAGLSPWWSLDSQWRLGALLTLMLMTLVGINWGILHLLRGPLGRAALEEEARAAAGGPGAATPLALALPGGLRLPAPAASRAPLPAGPTICAMSYADPEQMARVLAARPAILALPDAPAAVPPAKLRLELKHRLAAGRVMVLVDGRTVLSRPLEGMRGGTSETHVLSVAAGDHVVEVRLLGKKGAVEARSKIQGSIDHERTAVLRAEHRVPRKKGAEPVLALAWSDAR